MSSEDFRRLRTGHASCGRLSRVRVWALFTVPIVAVTACISITKNANSYTMNIVEPFNQVMNLPLHHHSDAVNAFQKLEAHIELVASFGNRSKVLKSWEKTETRAVRASEAHGPENVAITRIPVPRSGSESHAFFSSHRSRMMLWPSI